MDVGTSGGMLSPDGKRIVFTSLGTMYTMRSDGTGMKKIYEDEEGRVAITPSWSPDGRFILFGLDPPGSNSTIDTAPSRNGLYVVTAKGTRLTPLLVAKGWNKEPLWTAND